jgi:hypothetical protein
MNDAASSPSLSYEDALTAFSDQSLFENKTWLYSPEAFRLVLLSLNKLSKLVRPATIFTVRSRRSIFVQPRAKTSSVTAP